ncbi:MAG: phosphate regulon sensor histidine kinase PhoR [Duodenibacillus sp.]|nr:phosphate regulon sensor histidine kinase PhoR [Duodenibacillus sp.]
MAGRWEAAARRADEEPRRFSHWELVGAEAFRLAAVASVALAAEGLAGEPWGWITALAALLLMLLSRWLQSMRLLAWLEEPGRAPPEATDLLGLLIHERVFKNRRELERSVERVRVREERFRNAIANLPEAIVTIYRGRQVMWFNAMAADVFGLAPEHEGRPVTEALKDTGLVAWLLSDTADKTLAWTQAGTERSFEVTLVTSDAKFSVLIARDLTEQARLHAMRRDFVADVSHELRTPLTVINGFLELAAGGEGVALRPEHTALMREQSARMRSLVDDLLELSRLESGERRPEEQFPLDALVEDLAAQARCTCRHEVACETEPVIMTGRPEEMRSAVGNLITNAVRYTPGSGHIRVTLAREAGGGAAVTVADDGIGIEARHIPRLTERFYRVDKSRSRAGGGTGLGLAIVKHVLRQHGARLEIASEPGKGSSFTIRVPAHRCGDAP